MNSSIVDAMTRRARRIAQRIAGHPIPSSLQAAGQHEPSQALLDSWSEAAGHRRILAGLQEQLEAARSMQMSILPRHPPQASNVDVKAVMVPAHEVGGDFYDYFLLDEDHLAMVIADVSGKGVPAAFFMGIARTMLKTHAMTLREPVKVLEQLNAQLCAMNEHMMFVTAFFAVLNLRTGVLDFVNAGHNPPVIRARAGAIRMLPRGQNMALAVVGDLQFRKGRAVLSAGDTLLLYTDGVTEAIDPGGKLFGEQRLLDTVLRHRPEGGCLLQELLRKVREFECGRPQGDDIACLAVRFGAAVPC